jgi:hypothetical protein
MLQFLSVYYFTLLLLHVSATACHPQGTRLYLLSYMPIWVWVDNILCSMWLCAYYTELYQPKPKLVCNSEGTHEHPEDATQLPKHVGAKV